MPFINSIGLAQAAFSHQQKDIADFIIEMYTVPEEDIDKIKRMYDRSEIETRYSVIEDFSLPKSQWKFFEKNGTTSIEKRMQAYFDIAPELCVKAIRKSISDEQLSEITHLITVSCTGMSAPGLDVQLVQMLPFKNNVHRTSINFMGCYAGIQALKQAEAYCLSSPLAKVLIVDIELCTIHFQNEYSMDNIASSLLFGDGACAAVVSNEKGIYKLKSFYSELALQGYNDMAWHISSYGFQMSLSGYVPAIIAESIEPLLNNALSRMNIRREDVSHWAIHPGGKKIISEISKALHLTEQDTIVSRDVLLNYGNMSSATIFYVLHRMMQQEMRSGNTIFGCAFGPGLTIESMFLEVC